MSETRQRASTLLAAMLSGGVIALAAAILLPAGAAAARGPGHGGPRADSYPAGATRAAVPVTRRELRAATAANHARRRGGRSKKHAGPVLHGDPARALVAFEAMQKQYYIPGSGLYAGEPFSYLWPFSGALAATITLSNIPALAKTMANEVHRRLVGLQSYLDTNDSGEPEGSFTSTLPAFDGTVAPPAGPGGPKYYDDNAWVGIELMRRYKVVRTPALLGSAEGIMAFEMAGWQAEPEQGCPGGIPFSNAIENTDRNTVTDGPTAELAIQLYRMTGQAAYLGFAEMLYEWVRRCLEQPESLYQDHVNRQGVVEGSLWSYNQGSMIGAGTLLYQVTRNSAYLAEARATAAAALAHFTLPVLVGENPFFVAVYLRNLMYLDTVTHESSAVRVAQAYVDYAWENLRLSDNVFVGGSPPTAQLLVQSAIAQVYGLLSTPAYTYF